MKVQHPSVATATSQSSNSTFSLLIHAMQLLSPATLQVVPLEFLAVMRFDSEVTKVAKSFSRRQVL